MNDHNGKRVLVTGGSGFIGSHLTRQLVAAGAEVGIVTKYNSVMDNVRVVDLWDDVTVIEADMRNLDSLRQVHDFHPDVIYHLAAYNHVGDSFIHVSEALDSNLKGTSNLLEAYDEYERFVYMSTSEVYGKQDSVPFHEGMCPRPISPYSVGKYAGELYCRMRAECGDGRIVVVRPFNTYGPYQSPRAVVAELILKCLQGRVIKTTEGKQTREFNFVGNLVDGLLLAGTKDGVQGEILNLGCGEEVTIADLIRRIHRETDSSSEVQMGALPYRPTEIWRMSASSERARELLGWEPRVGLEEGLRLTIAWYRQFLAAYSQGQSTLSHLSSSCAEA